MTDTETTSFSDLGFIERIAEVDKRIGDQPGRIKSPLDLLSLYGQMIYIVVSPYGKEQDLGTCFIWEWVVGEIKDQYGKILKESDEIDVEAKKKYICYSHPGSDQETNTLLNVEHGISLRDFNINPNNYNNHCVFPTRELAEAYVLYRKLQFKEDEGIARLDGEYDFHVTIDQVKNLLQNEQTAANKS